MDKSHYERKRELSELEDCAAVKHRCVSEITSLGMDAWRYENIMVIENFCSR